MPETAFVRVASHRATDKLNRLLGYYPQCYRRWRKRGYYYEIPADQLAAALAITGIFKSRRTAEHFACISWV